MPLMSKDAAPMALFRRPAVSRLLPVVGALVLLALAALPAWGLGSGALGAGFRVTSSPVEVTTLIQRAGLTGEGESGDGFFGLSVALSADGQTAIVGAPADQGGAGSAFLFTRSGSTWVQQGPKLTGSEQAGGGSGEEGGGEGGEGRFGGSVVLSADGNTALVGGPGDRGNAGSAWVFIRSGSTWVQQGPKLTGAGEVGDGRFGRSVALSADGDRAVIGGSADSAAVGAAWVFARSGAGWAQQGSKLTGAAESGAGRFGGSVALSSDGSILLVSGPADNGWVGAAWVFAQDGAGWVQLGEKLTGAGEIGEGHFGRSVALSANGSTAIVGGRADDGHLGAAWVFAPSGGLWSQQGEKLTAGGESGLGEFGYSVALSGEGNTALIGGPHDEHSAGAAWTFTRSGSTWSQRGEKLTAGSQVGNGWFGSSAALSSDGSTGLIGGPRENGRLGAAWVFNEGTAETVASGATNPNGGVDAFTTTLLSTRSTARAPGTCNASLASRVVPVQRRARAALKLAGRGTRACKGRLTLAVRMKARNRRPQMRTVGASTFSIPAGRTRTVTVKLNAMGRLLLGAAHGRLGATVAILKMSPAPARSLTATVSLTLPRSSR
jgi:hypothetical protein